MVSKARNYEPAGKYSLIHFRRSLTYEIFSREAAKEIFVGRKLDESPSAIRAMLDLDATKIEAEEIYMYT